MIYENAKYIKLGQISPYFDYVVKVLNNLNISYIINYLFDYINIFIENKIIPLRVFWLSNWTITRLIFMISNWLRICGNQSNGLNIDPVVLPFFNKNASIYSLF